MEVVKGGAGSLAYVCRLCGMRFSNRDDLVDHLRDFHVVLTQDIEDLIIPQVVFGQNLGPKELLMEITDELEERGFDRYVNITTSAGYDDYLLVVDVPEYFEDDLTKTLDIIDSVMTVLERHGVPRTSARYMTAIDEDGEPVHRIACRLPLVAE